MYIQDSPVEIQTPAR